MKNKLFLLLGMLLLIQFSFSNACMRGYRIKNKKVYYMISHNKIKEMKEVDYKSFEIISLSLAKDEKKVYYYGEVVNNVNPKTYKIVSISEKYNFECVDASYILEDNGKIYHLEGEF